MASRRRSARLEGKAPDYNTDGSPTEEFTLRMSQELQIPVFAVFKTPYDSLERVNRAVECFDAIMGVPAILATYPILREELTKKMDTLCNDIMTRDLGDNMLRPIVEARYRFGVLLKTIKKATYYVA